VRVKCGAARSPSQSVQETRALIAKTAFDRPSRFLAALAALRAARATGFSAAKRAC